MAEDGAAPKASTPYGSAAALLGQAAADAQLPGAVVVLDSVLVRSSSSAPAHQQQHHHQPVQLLDEAVSVLSALAARRVPLALLSGGGGSDGGVQECLAEAGVQLHTVVQAQVQQQQQVEQQTEQQQPQQQHANANASSSSWMTDAAATLKAQTGVPWTQMLLFLPAGGSSGGDVARLARKLGMTVVSVPAVSGLSVACLRAGLSAYACKLEADRGY